jgi:hypothetical protein
MRPFGKSPASVLEIFLFHQSLAFTIWLNQHKRRRTARHQQQHRVAQGLMEWGKSCLSGQQVLLPYPLNLLCRIKLVKVVFVVSS